MIPKIFYDALKEPNPWAVIHEYSKTVIAIASGLLALTVTFSGQIIGSHSPSYVLYVLWACWGSLLLTIFCGLLAAAYLSEFLRHKKDKKTCIAWSNIAFFFLFFAGMAFLVFGIAQTRDSDAVLDGRAAVEKVLKSNLLTDSYTDWSVESMIWDDATRQWRLKMLFTTASKKRPAKIEYSIIVEAKYGKIIGFVKKPTNLGTQGY